MDTLVTAAASSDDAAPQSRPQKSPPESERDNEASSDVKEVSVMPVEESQPTPKLIIEEGDDRKCSYRDYSQVLPKPINPSSDVREVSVVPVVVAQPTPKLIIDEGDDRKSSYCDYSQVPPKPINPSTTNKEPTFPMKLHMILSNPAYQHIISWLPHGRSWRILQQKAFEQRVIPLFFRHGRYSSFARQVNGWGFSRISHGPDFGSYYHERFLRGMPHLCEKMRRLTRKDAGARKKVEEEHTPDFHALSRKHPIPEVPVIKDFPGNSEASFLARRAQMLQQMDLMAGSSMVPPMGMAGMGYLNGNLQDSLLNSMQFGGAPNNENVQMQNMQMQNMQLAMQNNILMREFLAAKMGGNPLGGGAANFGATNGLGMGGAPNFGAPNGMQGMGGTPNFGAPIGVQGMGGTPNFGAPNGLQGMGGSPNLGGPSSMGNVDMAQLLALQNGMQKGKESAQVGPSLAQSLWNQKYDGLNQLGGGMPNAV